MKPQVRNYKPLTEQQILRWALAYHRRTGGWPSGKDKSAMPESPRETWSKINANLRLGHRGLRKGWSLHRLLVATCGVKRRFVSHAPPGRLTLTEIWKWIRTYYKKHRVWPTGNLDFVEGGRGFTWSAVDQALSQGHRSLPGGSSVAKTIDGFLNGRPRLLRPALKRGQIIRWACEYHRKTGFWPIADSTPVQSGDDTTWAQVHESLRYGTRGLAPGGDSLAQFLHRHCGLKVHKRRISPLTIQQILEWADTYQRENKRWPQRRSGRVRLAPFALTWHAIDSALQWGSRELPGGMTLADLLLKYRGVKNIHNLPPLDIKIILRWADAHRRRAHRWPVPESGPIPGTIGETWAGVQGSLYNARRGLLHKRRTLAQLLNRYRGPRDAREIRRRVARRQFSRGPSRAWSRALRHERLHT